MKKYPFLPFKYIDHDNLSNLVAKINENLDIEKRKFQPWTATILGHDEEIYSTEAATEIPIC